MRGDGEDLILRHRRLEAAEQVRGVSRARRVDAREGRDDLGGIARGAQAERPRQTAAVTARQPFGREPRGV